MKNTHTHTTLRKIIFLIESLSSTELLSRTLMELWMSGYEAERIPIDQIMTQLSCFIAAPDTPNLSASSCSIHTPGGPLLPDRSPDADALPSPDCGPDTGPSPSPNRSPDADASPSPGNSPDAPNLHPLTPTHLIVTDRADIAKCCLRHGIAVIGYLHEQNKDVPFDGIGYIVEDLSGLDVSFCELAFCRAHHLPYTVLETERCLVREITTADVTRLYEIYADPSVTSYIEALYADETAERSYIRDYINNVYGFYGYGMWIVVNKENNQVIGRAGIEPKEDFAELGYVIAREYQNQGYATEVCRAILTYAADRLGLPDIYARVQKENAASLRICEKLHFQPVPRPEASDMLLFSLRLS